MAGLAMPLTIADLDDDADEELAPVVSKRDKDQSGYDEWLVAARAELQKITLKAMWDAVDYETAALEASQRALVLSHLRTAPDKDACARIKCMRAAMAVIELLIESRDEDFLRKLRTKLWLLV